MSLLVKLAIVFLLWDACLSPLPVFQAKGIHTGRKVHSSFLTVSGLAWGPDILLKQFGGAQKRNRKEATEMSKNDWKSEFRKARWIKIVSAREKKTWRGNGKEGSLKFLNGEFFENDVYSFCQAHGPTLIPVGENYWV